jgi:hypothetical protein
MLERDARRAGHINENHWIDGLGRWPDAAIGGDPDPD